MPQPWQKAVNGFILSPWFDRAAVPMLARWYFPLSRAWAAGLEAGRDRAAFAAALGRRSVSAWVADAPLAGLAARAQAHAEATRRWEDAFFGGAGGDLAAVEAARLEAAHALMAARSLFARLHMLRTVPAVRFAVAPPQEVQARHGARRADVGTAFALPPTAPGWEVSAAFERAGRRQGWLRLPAPVPAHPGDRLWARVVEPVDRPCIGTLVFTHGIAMEDEHWRGRVTPFAALTARGLRLVLPEGPGHGRRRCPGLYGGEQVLAGGPLGMLDYQHAHAVELGLLIAWARGLDAGAPVGLGGVSLGALTAQRAAVAATAWPVEARPDSLLLITPSRSMQAVVFDGALTKALRVPQALAAAGWTPEAVEPWRPLLEPGTPPAVDPARIVLVLGENDEVTPFAEGRALADAWAVPPANVFTRPRGHFTTPIALSAQRDPEPLSRFAAVTAA
ncbi:hypothetical protein ACM64Y_19405 [Novispirillum sp. DQ9]|uniref:hypothetical protein n=1 Tax=Novispirillum sp. DQ9 TaxID=3398612 RepID=UPI003C7C0F40